MKYLIWVICCLVAPAGAWAQSSYPTSDGTNRVAASAILVPNASGVATPPSAGNPLVVGAITQAVNFSSCGGIIAQTGVAQLVTVANTARHYLVVDNSSANAMSLGLADNVTISTGIPVFPGGGGYEWASAVPTNAIYVVGTAGSQYVCWQG